MNRGSYLCYQNFRIWFSGSAFACSNQTSRFSSSISMKLFKKAAVLYHHPCSDGVFAALAAHLYFSSTSTPVVFLPNTVYSPIRAEKLPFHEIDNLYLLDFIGPPGFVEQVSSKVDRVIILDHHQGALEMLKSQTLKDNCVKVIDMERSAATIAFSYFKAMLVFAHNREDHKITIDHYDRLKRLFEYIEDADLWRWRLPNSKAFHSGLNDLCIDFNARSNPTLFDQLLSLDADLVISKGIASLSEKQGLIDEALNRSYEISIGAGKFGRCLVI